MASQSVSTVDLVTYSPATDVPRAFHTRLATIMPEHADSVCVRVFHQNVAVRTQSATFSRAHWLDLSILFVPTPAALNRSISIAASVVGDNRAPTSRLELYETPACQHFQGGGNDVLPPIFRMPVVFDDANVSRLIKPIPIEQHRGSVVFHFSVSDGSDADADNKDALMNVFMVGKLVVGGRD